MKRRITLTLHGLAALLTMTMGVLYLSREVAMPYHLDALGTTWDALDPRFQILYLGLLKGVGAGYLATGISCLLMVAVPLRRGANWAGWAPTVVTLTAMIPLAGIILYLRANTVAEPPLVFPLVVIGLSLLGGLSSLIDRPSAT